MKITFTKTSDLEHSVHIQRADGSEDKNTLNSRSFLRHDLAHLAVEMELPLAKGYWGSVAAGASLEGKEIRGPEIMVAESLAGPVQGLMRTESSVETFFSTLNRIRPGLITEELAARIHERCRQLTGHWQATPYGGEMVLEWGQQ